VIEELENEDEEYDAEDDENEDEEEEEEDDFSKQYYGGMYEDVMINRKGAKLTGSFIESKK